ncbi:MAG: hypothetical protein E6Q36_00440 [Chryseobacterium sp.]|nr:MAG: hypothetical protein E6Q36_00440 [Chryseobacterium sp.]
MSIYEQAVSDTKQYVAVAEERAKAALLRGVLPHIRQLIESEIVGTDSADLVNDLNVQVTEPDASGNVVLTVTPAAEEQPEQPAPKAAQQAIVPVIPSPPTPSVPDATVTDTVTQTEDDVNTCVDDECSADLERAVTEACAKANRMLNANVAKKSAAFSAHLQELKAHMADMYTQINADDAKQDASKKRLSEALEHSLARLAIGEIGMAKTLRENDISLKLTGMPDDVNFDDVGVEIETDAADDSADHDDSDADTTDADDSDESSDDKTSDDETLDFSSDDEEKNEATTLDSDDDDMIEIDESEIRAELSRMRAVREAEARPDNRGMGPGDADVFGDGEEEGDPLTDIDVMSERSVSKLRALKTEAIRKGNIKLYRECRARISTLTRVSPVSRDRVRPANTAAKRVTVASRHLSEAKTQLAEANLNNAQLAYANKLLLRNDLSNSQKRDSLVRLSNAKTVREVKVIFESIISLLDGRSTLNESRGARRHLGAASRTTGSGSSTITESVDAARWSLLAGLNG